MDPIDFSPAEARATEWKRDNPSDLSGEVFHNTLLALRDLLTSSEPDQTSVTTTATSLADFIRTFTRAPDFSDDQRFFLTVCCWHSLDALARCIPPHHPWHTSLVRTIHILRARGDEQIYSAAELQYYKWSDLPQLSSLFWNAWDQSQLLKRNEYDSPEAKKEVSEWKSWVSWFAQMPAEIALPHYALSAIKLIEEKVDERKVKAEVDLWTACEWLIYKADKIWEYMRGCKKNCERRGVKGDASEMGEVCRESVGDPWGKERWEWWKGCLRERAGGGDIDGELRKKIARAVASMEAAEGSGEE